MLDTCAISELAKRQPDKNVVNWINRADEELLYLSVLTVGEIQKGISKLGDLRKRTKIQEWIDSELRTRFSRRVLPITEEVALTWGTIEGAAEAEGRPIPIIDGLIGATAIAHNLTVITRNVADIASTGARVFDPWKPAWSN